MSSRGTIPVSPRIDVHLPPEWARPALAADVREGLTKQPKELPPKWFYDARGSVLFDEITRLPEYYPTECERAILHARAGEIAALAGCEVLVELGSGTSDKTRVLLDALWDTPALFGYVPFDVSETTLRDSATAIASEYPGLFVHGVVGDFDHHLETIPAEGRRLVALLGGTIGNYRPKERAELLGVIGHLLAPGETLLLGTDLVKDPGRLVRAYDDSAGVTAAFNRNVLAVINRELSADFALEHFDHVARWDAEEEWIEMRLRSDRAQRVTIRDLDLEVAFAAGEDLLTEISAKFRAERVERELLRAGMVAEAFWTDPSGSFGLTLARRV